MLATARTDSSFSTLLPNEDATRHLAAEIADVLAPGDVVTLSGDLGAGKTTFARALIRHFAHDDEYEVPSPTFTLMQVYELTGATVVHADFYRVAAASEIDELGFAEAAHGAIVLVEWPERADQALPPDRLDVALALAPNHGPHSRQAVVTGHGALVARMERLGAVRQVLGQAGFADAERRHIQGDASTRSYERLAAGDRTAILMNAPRRADGPPIKGGLPYSAIAHLAEDVTAFVAMARGLKARGFSAPDIYAADLERGLVVLEDLGNEGVIASDSGGPIEERYAAAVDLLLALHCQALPEALPVAVGAEYRLPRYDTDAFLIEAELFCDWYLTHRGMEIEDVVRNEFTLLWRGALRAAIAAPPTWVLRDYHSPNLLWLPQRARTARVGLLDFQDALLGPAAYDLVSLLQDARVDVPEAMELELLGRYTKAQREADASFDAARFIELYAVLGAQRATKILGIFARLDRRDGKPQYLRHMPRVWGYLRRSLVHPVLAGLASWYEAHATSPNV
jgi:tRNA threonylcarbamoyl adenosine modification protein YjeE